jgi:hypothetical protein
MIVAPSWVERLRPLVLITAALVLMAPGTAQGEEISIAVGVPTSVSVGDNVDIKAIVTSGGGPVEGAIVSLTYSASFAGESGRVELDRETTSADGVALLTYVQRASDNGEMRVEYVGPEEMSVTPVVFDIDVQPGGEQQHRSEAGVNIPWLNGSVVIAVIMIVWGLIVFSAVQLVMVGRSANKVVESARAGADPAVDGGSTWISFALAAATIVTAVGMVVVFVRNPVTHANLNDPAGYDRTPVAHVGQELPYLGPGLEAPSLAQSGEELTDGELTYFQFGCAGCHGLEGDGGASAPELAGEVGSQGGFAEDIREGPEEMPSYGGEVLSADQLALIHKYLDQG